MRKRFLAVFCIACLLMGMLVFRFYSLGTSEKLSQTANRQGTKTLTVSSFRGMIYDCNYQRLVNTQKRYIAAVLPTPRSAAELLRHVPSLNRTNVLNQLEKGELFTTELETPIPADTTELHTFSVYQRYAEDQLAPHIVGHMTNGGLNGGYGIEKAYDAFLKEHETKSTIRYYLDAQGRSIPGKEPALSLSNPPEAGVVLTLDSRIQKIAEEAGSKYLSKGAVVVMTPDGKIRACASFPSFSPLNLTESLKDEVNKPMINRAFSSYTVGSTFKIVTAAAALESGISPTRTLRCTGQIDVKGQIFNCHRHQGHGLLNMERAMAESCNPYYISLGLDLDKERFYQMAKDLSFSKKSEFASGFSAQSGYLPTVKELFNPAAVANLSFGQGTLLATPVQIARMTCAIVNGGKTPAAKLIEGLSEDGKGLTEQQKEEAMIYAMSEKTADIIKEFLTASVMEKENQYAKPTKTTAGGKTATAQTGMYKATGEEMVHGWFSGFFPAESPRYVVTVLCEDAESGNQSAGPVFREIADRITAEVPISARN